MQRNIIITSIILLCSLLLTGCGVKVTGVKIATDTELTQGEVSNISLEYEFNHNGSEDEKKEAIANENFYVSSDAKDVVVIAGESAVASGGGTATLTAKNEDGTITDSITVTVLPRPSQFSIPQSITLTLGSDEIVKIEPEVEPAEFDWSDCAYSSDDESIVTISSDGTLTAIGEGSTKVHAVLPKIGIDRACSVTVTSQLEKISMQKNDIEIYPGNSIYIGCTTTPETFNQTLIQWSSSDDSIVSVNGSGYITAKKSGIAFIRAEYKDVYAVCAVTVKKQEDKKTTTGTNGVLPEGDGKHNTWYKYQDSTTYDALFNEINQYRSQNGVAALQKSSTLTSKAETRTDGMVKGSSDVSGYAELLAKNGKTAKDVAQAWYNSEYYRSVLLDSNYTICGIGIDYDGDGCSAWVMLLA